MAPSRVQYETGSRLLGDAGVTYTITLTGAPTNGNALYLIHANGYASGQTISSVSQTGATWAKVISKTQGTAVNVELWQALNVSGAGTVVTVTMSAACGCAGVVAEYSGIVTSSATDKTASDSGSSASGSSGTTAETTQAVELWIGGIGDASSATESNPTNDFTLVIDKGNPTVVHIGFYEKIVSATGAASVGCTLSASVGWAGVIGTFKAQGFAGEFLGIANASIGAVSFGGTDIAKANISDIVYG